MHALVLALALAALPGCLEPESIRCGELYCAAGTVCAEAAGRCATTAAISACEAQPPGASCSAPGISSGSCRLGVCSADECGDGQVTGAEVCDDANTTACDGCSADCRSTEQCGNGLLECAEECDQGEQNSDSPNGVCRTTCELQRCGDGIVDDRSGEDCDGASNPLVSCQDYGFYGGELSCSSASCRNDTSTCVGSCGDGEVNGSEFCDALPPGGETCLEYGYDVGNLVCSPFCTPAFAGCERLGFEAMPLDVSAYLLWVWGAAADDVYAVGDAAAAIHYDGRRWASIEFGFDVPSTTSLNGVWGSGADDVFVVGDEGTILHYDGERWSKMDSDTDATLMSVWGSGPHDVFAVGEAGVIVHYDGERWARADFEFDGGTLWNVFGTSSDRVFVVGDSRGIFRFDGSEWTAMPPPPVGEDLGFYGVWADDDDLFASGDYGVMVHHDGDDWELQPTAITGSYLYGMWGLSDSSLYVSGTLGTLLHYDGSVWSQLSSGTVQDIFAIWGSAEDDIFTVGPGTVLHLGQGGPNVALIDTLTGERLNHAWGTSLADVIVVGENGTIVEFDGNTAAAMESGTSEQLNWLWGSARDELFAVGAAGTILRYDGEAWSPEDSGTDALLTSIWGSAPDDVFAAGDGGTVLHYDGERWSPLDSGTDTYLYNLWGSGPNDVFFAGSTGVLLHYDGERVSPMEIDTDGEIWGLWGTAPDDVYAFVDIEGAFHYDGSRWSPLTFQSSQALDYADGSSNADIFSITTFAAALFHYDGLDWAPLRLPPNTPALHGVWMIPEGGYVTADAGSLLRVDRRCAERETNCEDRWDNDCDGAANCADADCAASDYCRNGGLCATKSVLSCGSALTSSTVGYPPLLELYTCSPRVESGREQIHRFTAESSGVVSVTLSNLTSDLDLVVLGATSTGACDPRRHCLGSSTGERSEHGVTFTAAEGDTYFVIVEGYDEAAGGYSLEVTCP